MKVATLKTFVISAAFLAAAAISVRAAENLHADAQATIEAFMQKDPALEKFMETSAGYAVFPNITEGGFIVGGAHGDGLVYQNGKPVGEATVTKASIGAQAGGQSFAEIIFFQTPEALQQFKA